MNKILNQYKCQIINHEGKQIIGICENKNCKQPYRRVCFDCQQVHSKEDQAFQLSDIKDESKLEKIIEEFKQKMKQKIDQIDLQFTIQKYLLTLEMSEFLNRWRYKIIELNKVCQQLNQFIKIFQTVSVEGYIIGNYKEQGIFGYLSRVEEQLQQVDDQKTQYLINIVNIKQIQEDCKTLAPQNIQSAQVNQFQEQCLFEPLSQLSKIKGLQFQKISKNIQDQQSKQPQQKNDHHIQFWEYILRQGFELKTQNLHEQFQNLKNQNKLEMYQDLYLQAYSLHYSEAQITKIQEQMSLIDQSIQLNNNYTKSKDLKKLIEAKLQMQIKNLNETEFVANQMANEYMEKGVSFFKNNQYSEAINQFDQAIKLNPKQQHLYFIKGVSFQKLNRHEEAKNMFDIAIGLKPNDIHAQQQKVISLQYLKKYEEALQLIDCVVQLDPRNVEFQQILKGSVMEKLKRYEEALQQYDQAMQIDPSVPQAYNNKGVLLDNLKRYDQAIDMFDKCIKLDPQLQNAYQNKGITLLQLNRFMEALAMFNESIKLNPQCIQAYKYKGKCLIQLGRHQEAEQTYKECYQQNPQAQIRDDDLSQE